MSVDGQDPVAELQHAGRRRALLELLDRRRAGHVRDRRPDVAECDLRAQAAGEEQEPEDRERDHEVDERAGEDHEDPLPDGLVVVGAGGDLRLEAVDLLGFMPVIFTYPPSGIAPIPYSVSPRRTLKRSGGKNRQKRSTRMPTALAAVKWPNSWRMISSGEAEQGEEQDTHPVSQASLKASCGPSGRRRARAALEPARGRQVPRTPVDFEERLERADRLRAEPVEHGVDHLGDPEEGEPAGEERVDRDLVGGVQHARRGPAGRRGLPGKPQAREGVAVDGLEGQAAERDQVERGDRQRRPVGVVQGVGDRDAHVGIAEVGERRPVAEVTRLWMIDCGWTTTSIRSYGVPKRWCASITSSPLFISVAESIVILPPIAQVGWAQRLLDGHRSSSSRGRSRGTGRRRR